MKSLIFTSNSIRAILEGRKSQTRRIIKPQPDWVENPIIENGYAIANSPYQTDNFDIEFSAEAIKLKFQPGDIIYAKETWTEIIEESVGFYEILYKADCREDYAKNIKGWKSPLFMPEKVARIFLEITGVRVERLQDISEEDAIAEGLLMNDMPHVGWYWMRNVYCTDNPIYAYEKLWQSIHGKDSWEKNPWLFVYEFQVKESEEGIEDEGEPEAWAGGFADNH